jgi:cytochrome b involved in lipid metabolism
MNNKKLWIAFGIIVLIVIGFVLLKGSNYTRDTSDLGGYSIVPGTDTNASTTSNSEDSIGSSRTYTLGEVAVHNSASSCWTTINGGVYDVTNWINQHPGGSQAILSLCGKDGSVAFNGQHGGQPRPASELATFKIGTLSR